LPSCWAASGIPDQQLVQLRICRVLLHDLVGGHRVQRAPHDVLGHRLVELHDDDGAVR
jgi:hypothetical protein